MYLKVYPIQSANPVEIARDFGAHFAEWLFSFWELFHRQEQAKSLFRLPKIAFFPKNLRFFFSKATSLPSRSRRSLRPPFDSSLSSRYTQSAICFSKAFFHEDTAAFRSPFLIVNCAPCPAQRPCFLPGRTKSFPSCAPRTPCQKKIFSAATTAGAPCAWRGRWIFRSWAFCPG